MKKLEIEGMDVATVTSIVRKLENIGGKKIGLQFLPFYESPTEETMWDVVRAVSPMANFRSQDGEAEIVGQVAFDRAYADIVDFAVKKRFNVSDLRRIREAGMLPLVDGQSSLAAKQGEAAKRKIREALENLKLRIDNRLEWMQINALQGSISFTGKIVFSVDYAIPGDQRVTLSGTAKWDDTTNSTPLENIQSWQQTALDNNGVLLDTIIMSTKSLNYIMNNAKIRDAMKYTNPVLSISRTIEFLKSNSGIDIVLYDSRYTDETGTTRTRFLSEDKVILLPSRAELPEGVGDTATVAHPLANYTPGYYTWQETVKDPYGLEIGVGLTAFPRIKHPEALFVVDVF